MDEDLRFPIGEFLAADPIEAAQVRQWIDDIAALPALARAQVAGYSPEQLATRYRPGAGRFRRSSITWRTAT